MGFRRILQDQDTSFMYADIRTPNQIVIMLLRSNSAFTVKLKTDSDSVAKWCRNLQKTPDEYMSLLHKACENCALTYGVSDTEDPQEDVFEIQEGSLVWKQFFPDKKVYGRRGKFTLDETSYEHGVNQVLNGALKELEGKCTSLQKLENELSTKSKELKEAQQLAAKCVWEKEEFEKEIYGKCASLINAKKLRINQLLSNQPSTAGVQSHVTRQILTDSHPSSQTSKSSKESPESDGYSSDTDVDDPDVEEIDTDEENLQKASAQKEKRKANLGSKSNASKRVFDSQDDVFNNSLEAELYSADTVNKKNKLSDENVREMSVKDTKCKNKAWTPSRENKNVPSKSGDNVVQCSKETNSQSSIIDELF